MSLDFLIFYGSYREGRLGIRLADYLVRNLSARGHRAELVDAMAVDLPMLNKRYSDYPDGAAPPAMAALAQRILAADGFVFVAGEYNSGVQPGLKNLVDTFVLAQWGGRPAAIASYSAGRFGGAKSYAAWHPTLATQGMVIMPTGLSVGQIGQALDAAGQPTGEGGAVLDKAFPGFAATLEWWAEAAKARKARP